MYGTLRHRMELKRPRKKMNSTAPPTLPTAGAARLGRTLLPRVSPPPAQAPVSFRRLLAVIAIYWLYVTVSDILYANSLRVGFSQLTSARLFVVAKGANRGQPLTPAGLRTIFRYHRAKAGVSAGHPHALRHSFGTALAEAGVDLPVMQALLGHEHVDTSARYIHLAPARVKAEFDAARARIRNGG